MAGDCDNVMIETRDVDARRVELVAERFLRQQAQGRFPGGQLVARRGGRVILNLNCGLARGWRNRGGDAPIEVRETTPFPVYSAGKPMAAIIVASLEARGLLDLTAPIASILPDFAGMGRDGITTLDVLTHRAGILLPDLVTHYEKWGNGDDTWRHLVSTPPRYPRGTFAYMPTEFGIILDRIVPELTGVNVARQFHDAFAKPLGLTAMHYGLGDLALDELAWTYWLTDRKRYMVAGINVADRFEEKANHDFVFSAMNPAFSMVANAMSLAAFYECLVNGGRAPDGAQLIPEPILKRYTSRQVSGWNRSVRSYLSLGYGFMLGLPVPSFYGWWGSSGCFGHPGLFSSIAFADHDTGLSMAVVTNGTRGIGDFFRKMISLTHGMRLACR